MERYPLETLSRSKTNNFFFLYIEGLFNREEKSVVSNENSKKAIGIYIRKTLTLQVHHHMNIYILISRARFME